MMQSKPIFRTRCRPLFGTLVRVQLDETDDRAFEAAFDELTTHERLFNFHAPESELSRFNAAMEMDLSPIFVRLLTFALRLRRETGGAFTPFYEEQRGACLLPEDPLEIQADGRARKKAACRLDFGGVAKGFAVDRAVERIAREFPACSGYVEAGGDVRYFGEADRRIGLRIGAPPNVFLRELDLFKSAVATTSPGTAKLYGPSKTEYGPGFDAEKTIVVMAESCAMADALTKAVRPGLSCFAKQFPAEALIFDAAGDCVESTLS